MSNYVLPQDSVSPYAVYGFTDRWHGNGFPACDAPIEALDAAIEHLKHIGNRGFRCVNSKGWRGWINDATGKTVSLDNLNIN